MEQIKKYGVQIALVAVLAGGGIVWRFFNSGNTAAEWRTEMTNLCTDDQACRAQVETHFQPCFDSVYASTSDDNTNQSRMVACINERAGTPLFRLE